MKGKVYPSIKRKKCMLVFTTTSIKKLNQVLTSATSIWTSLRIPATSGMILALSSICEITQAISTLPVVIFPAKHFELLLAIFVYNNTNRQTFLSSLSQVKAHNNTKSSVF
jgi:hypothetical protein